MPGHAIWIVRTQTRRYVRALSGRPDTRSDNVWFAGQAAAGRRQGLRISRIRIPDRIHSKSIAPCAPWMSSQLYAASTGSWETRRLISIDEPDLGSRPRLEVGLLM